ncbi:hypothetical protein R1sor_005211 [Riccia sorocarpa]|uniref:Phosphatidic acid phosphatase type 2/haloperoxidase domain-containing protein n=1 Tax=Riccia sorocarpa TaxID=122646 RepID=A0ABD3HIW3_9MARC
MPLKAVSLTHVRREMQAMAFALGLFISEAINQVIKKAVKEARPLTCELLEMCDSHGWPSSHSQFMCFFSIYLSLLALRRFHFSDSFSKYFTVFISWPFTLVTIYSRVYLGYHSVSQVIAGSTVGLLLGAGWFIIVNRHLVKIFPAIEDTAICRYLCIKDSSHIPNVLQFEYDNSRAARKKDKVRAE